MLYKIKLKTFLAILLLGILNIHVAHAHHGAEAPITGSRVSGPIITLPAYTLPKKRYFIGTGVNYSHFDRFSSLKIRSLNSRRIHSHNNGDILSPTVFAGYGVTDDWTLSFNLPYVYKFNTQSTIAGITLDQGNAVGLGDLTLLSQYRFLKDKKHRLQSALFAGIKIPTGETDEKDRFGVKIAADDQAGTGSWDPIMGLAISKEFDKFSLHASGLYKLATEGSQDTVSGDVVNYGLAISHKVCKCDGFLYKIFPAHLLGSDLVWDLVMELNGQWSENVEVAGVRDSNHGGNLLYLTPGLRVIMDEKWVLNFATSANVMHSLNGEQSRPDVQLFFNLSRVF